MKAVDLITCLKVQNAESLNLEQLEITSLSQDTRKVQPGSCFVCISGSHFDGHDLADKAVEQGAVLLVAERQLAVAVPVIVVADTKKALAKLAVAFYQDPSSEMTVIGVTGTNGKTTITHLLAEILEQQNMPTGIIGTMYNKIGSEKRATINTTPDSLSNQCLLREMRQVEMDACAMEVSSHALMQGRTWGVDFQIAVFTNLTQDHLEYHHTMENYFWAKSLLFSQLGNSYHQKHQVKTAVINLDDVYGQRLLDLTAADVFTYGKHPDAHIRAENIIITSRGTEFKLCFHQHVFSVCLQLIGDFNVSNALAAFGAAVAAGIEPAAAAAALEAVKGVHGRFELIPTPFEATVIVDYAHTPDGLLNVLQTAKKVRSGQTICVVGCGGDRDATKRPVMAKVATEYADQVVFTSDNPRTEDPDLILDQMTAELQADNYTRITDRREAIYYALAHATTGDLVMIAGKGHEDYQIIGTVKHHFDDAEVVADYFGNINS